MEHVGGFYRQNGAVETRRGTLHWSRSFRIAGTRDGDLLQCILGDWTTLVEWVSSEIEPGILRDPRYEEVDPRKADCEAIFDVLDRWASTREAEETAETAQAMRLPFARVRRPEELANDEQLAARGLDVVAAALADGSDLRRPGPSPRCRRQSIPHEKGLRGWWPGPSVSSPGRFGCSSRQKEISSTVF